ncbi:MAG: class I SAM-dependent methyltransferase [Actinomycetota bacterium]|nr:class I SAM-dependent methyltransferase [Actinomycetota bacterium]
MTSSGQPPFDPKTANVLYHDAAARSYDAKWSISFDERCISYVRERADRMLPRPGYGRVLEVGCGTGFFLLNLWQAGFVEEAHACDISPGMLEACGKSAAELGCEIELRTGDAEHLPYDDRTFDLVVGHAFLHHLPDPPAALAEFLRVLVPGGAVFLAGEPTRRGDRLAAHAKTVTGRAFGLAARVRPDIRKPAAPEATEEEDRVIRDLEFAVDLHTFEPVQLALWAREAGFGAVRVETEELTASVVGWAVRTIEASVRPGLLGERWANFAYGAWRRLYRLDQSVLYQVLPHDLFYNALLYGERPDG